MRDNERIKTNERINVRMTGIDGGCGIIHVGGWEGSVIWSYDGGWDHVSVSPFKHRITPSWDDMCKIKEIFFNDDETVIQIHPAKTEYVNNMENCLHLWRYQGEMPLPPSWMVGVKDGDGVSETCKKALKVLGI